MTAAFFDFNDVVKLTDNGGLLFECPGCDTLHCVYVKDPSPTGQRWEWNYSLEQPTLSPSILVTIPGTESRCHSYIRHGQIEFLQDCSHELAGHTVPLQPFEDK